MKKQQRLSVSGIIGMFHEVGLFIPTRTIYFGGTGFWVKMMWFLVKR